MKGLAPLALVLAAPVLLAGCVSHPLTAEEFRLAVPGAFSGKVEQFEVDRSFRDVGAAFSRKAPECLAVAIETTSRTNTSYQHYTTTYKPTVVKSDERVELHVQQHIDNVVKVSEEPDGGYFLLVADAYPAGKSRTRVQLFRPRIGYGVLVDAIKGWASGNDMGCPDMTKI